MKVRTGFVSNSSSSSFLIVCKDFSEFDKFKCFIDYDVFKEDYNDSSEEDAKIWIETEFKDYFYNLVYAAKHKNDYMRSFYLDRHDDNNIVDLLFTENKYYDQSNALFTSYMNKINGYIRDDKVEEAEAFVRNDVDYDQLTDALMKKHKDKGFTLRAVSYEDHSEVGSYMEHQFMPFLSYNPESEYKQVYRRNEH